MTPSERSNRIAALRGAVAELDKGNTTKARGIINTQIRCLEEYQRREPDLLRLVEMEAKAPGTIPAYDRLLIDPPSPYEVSQIEEGKQP